MGRVHRAVVAQLGSRSARSVAVGVKGARCNMTPIQHDR